jgi:hypothetical protein
MALVVRIVTISDIMNYYCRVSRRESGWSTFRVGNDGVITPFLVVFDKGFSAAGDVHFRGRSSLETCPLSMLPLQHKQFAKTRLKFMSQTQVDHSGLVVNNWRDFPAWRMIGEMECRG